MSFKNIAKYATQIAVTMYVSSFTNKLVGKLFDQAFGTEKKTNKNIGVK